MQECTLLHTVTATSGFCAPTLPVGSVRSLSPAVGTLSTPSGSPQPLLKKRCRPHVLHNCVKPVMLSAAPRSNNLPRGGRIRQGAAPDAFTMSKLVLSCGMNPFIGDISNFLVFETAEGEVIGGGQVRPGDPGELASLAVKAPWRNKGIGTAIARALIEKEDDSRSICLLCLTRGVSFYDSLGFSVCNANELPQSIQLERKLGSLVAGIVAPGNECVGMLRSKKV